MVTNEHKLLDHGYVRLIEKLGSDERIIESARMSTGKGFNGWGPRCPHGNKFGECLKDEACASGTASTTPGDEKLLRFLWESGHTSPFEMGELVFEIQAPIMVFREWHRHRTQSYNEMSARYIPLPDVNYVPSVGRLLANSKTNKQAGTIKGAEELTADVATDLMLEEREFNAAAERFYQKKLQAGVPKELARTHLGVSRYSRMRAKANLLNWLKFLKQRMASGAQWEIRQYANSIGYMISKEFPRTWELFSKEV